MSAVATDSDLKHIVLSNSTFGPAEIRQLSQAISADYGQFTLLRDAVASRLRAAVPLQRIHLPSAAAKLRGRLYRMGVVAEETIADDGGWDLHVHLDAGHLRHLLREAGVIVNEGEPVESLASG